MSAINYAIDIIRNNKIPPQILEIAFKDNVQWTHFPSSLQERIKNKVILSRVMTDCNLVGGQHVVIPLDGINPEYWDNFNLVYRIPLEKSQGRNILSVLSCGYMPIMSGTGLSIAGYMPVFGLNTSDLSSVANRIHDSNASVPPISNANVELIGDNVVCIRDQFTTTKMYYLRCVIGNENDLSNLNPKTYIYFLELCTLAIKSYIYNNLIVTIDENYIYQGQELGIVKTIIESYSDTEEQYIEYLHTWGKVAFMNDQTRHSRFIRLQMSSQL